MVPIGHPFVGGFWQQPWQLIMQKQNDKILIIKLGALGDVVMATALIKQIQRHHSDQALFLLTSPPFEKLFQAWSDINIKSINRHGPRSLIEMICWIRKNQFNRVYDLQSNDRSRLLLSLSGIKERVGNHPAFPYNIHPGSKYLGETHIFDRMNLLLASAKVSKAEPKPIIPSQKKDIDFVRHWLEQQSLRNEKFVLLHAGASPKHPEKCWPYFREIALKLETNGFAPVWLGSDPEININRSYSSTCGIDATNVFSLTQLPLLANHAAFCMTNDSGPMHILSASDRPIYAFFGPTNWRRNHALGQAKRVITNQPTNIQGKRLLDQAYALDKISIEMVLEKLKQDGILN